MKRAMTLLALVCFLVVGVATGATAEPTEEISSSLGLEGAFGLQSGDTWVSAFLQAYEIDEAGEHSTVFVGTFFVDGASQMECFAAVEDPSVSIDPDLRSAAVSGGFEGTCFDFTTEETVPFSAAVSLEAVGDGPPRTRGGSYVDDGYRCVSQRRNRNASAAGTIAFAVEDGIEAAGPVRDDLADLVGFEQHCHKMEGEPRSGHH